MSRFMHAGITCTCIFSSSAHKCPAYLSVIGGAFQLKSIIWCTWILRNLEVVWNLEVVRYSGAVRSSKCSESTRLAVGASTYPLYGRHLLLGVPLTEVPLYSEMHRKAPKMKGKYFILLTLGAHAQRGLQ